MSNYRRGQTRVRVDLLIAVHEGEEVADFLETIYETLDRIPAVFCEGAKVEPSIQPSEVA